MKWITVFRNKAGSDLAFHAKTLMGKDGMSWDARTMCFLPVLPLQGGLMWLRCILSKLKRLGGMVSPFKPWSSPCQRRSCSRPCWPSSRCPPSQVTWFCSLPPSQAHSWVPSDVMGVLLNSCPTTSFPFFEYLCCLLAASVLPFLFCTYLCHWWIDELTFAGSAWCEHGAVDRQAASLLPLAVGSLWVVFHVIPCGTNQPSRSKQKVLEFRL